MSMLVSVIGPKPTSLPLIWLQSNPGKFVLERDTTRISIDVSPIMCISRNATHLPPLRRALITVLA
jgi:hypothetical protein